MRTFVSIDLSDEAVEEIKRIQEQLSKSNLFTGKVTEVENLHLTLKFLGDVDSGQLALIKEKLKEIKIKKFNVKLGKIGVFSESFIKIIWVELKGEGVLELQKKVDEVLKGIFKPEYRFMSHITIARVKSVRDKKEFLDFIRRIKVKEVNFKINRYDLMKSVLSSQGPKYESIDEFNLK